MDRPDLEQLIERHRPYMLALARAKLRDDALAEDAVQLACISVWRAASSLRFENEAKARRYLAIATATASIDVLRQHPAAAEVSYSDVLSDPETHGLTRRSADEDIAAREQARTVLRLMEAMGPKYYEILSLHAEGYTNKEIAAMLGLTVYDVGTTIYRGRKRLREALRKEELL